MVYRHPHVESPDESVYAPIPEWALQPPVPTPPSKPSPGYGEGLTEHSLTLSRSPECLHHD